MDLSRLSKYPANIPNEGEGDDSRVIPETMN